MTFWMAARMRTADAPLGLRGYEIRTFRGDDGVWFSAAHSIRRENVPIPGFERPEAPSGGAECNASGES